MTVLISWFHVALAVVTTADPVPEPSDVKPGWVSGVVVAALVAASVLLWFSMRKQLGKIRVPRRDEMAAEEAAEQADKQADGQATGQQSPHNGDSTAPRS